MFRQFGDSPVSRQRLSRTQGLALHAVLLAQVFFTTLFVFKILADVLALPLYFVPWTAMELIEVLASIGMLSGVISSVLLLRQGNKRMEELAQRIHAASGEFQDYLNDQFAEWRLTPTEQNIAILVIKGFSNQEIAQLRGTTESTVKSQISAIFRKSGVTNRQQLVTWVVEDLIEVLTPDAGDTQRKTS